MERNWRPWPELQEIPFPGLTGDTPERTLRFKSWFLFWSLVYCSSTKWRFAFANSHFTFLNTHLSANSEHDVNKSKSVTFDPLPDCSCMQHKSSVVPEMYPGMQLIGTTPPKKTNNGPVLQQCVQEMWNRLKERRGCWTRHLLTLDQERERSVGWFEELQLDEVMVFVAKLVTFLVVCGICSVTIVAVGDLS